MTTNNTMMELIDQIYDDIQNQTCENCIFACEHNELQALYCTEGISSDYSLGEDIIEEDFGCNKFEPKG
jgi:hypothetical protein